MVEYDAAAYGKRYIRNCISKTWCNQVLNYCDNSITVNGRTFCYSFSVKCCEKANCNDLTYGASTASSLLERKYLFLISIFSILSALLK